MHSVVLRNSQIYSLQIMVQSLLGVKLEELSSKARLEVVKLLLGELAFWLEAVDPWATDLEVFVWAARREDCQQSGTDFN
jgi:hypothetical protein